MYLRTNQVYPLRRHYSVAPRQSLGAFDMGSIAILLVGGAIGAFVYAALYGKGSGDTVSRRAYKHVVDQNYRCSAARDYEVLEGMSRDAALRKAEEELEEMRAEEAAESAS